jgi:hypothetical protein
VGQPAARYVAKLYRQVAGGGRSAARLLLLLWFAQGGYCQQHVIYGGPPSSAQAPTCDNTHACRRGSVPPAALQVQGGLPPAALQVYIQLVGLSSLACVGR